MNGRGQGRCTRPKFPFRVRVNVGRSFGLLQNNHKVPHPDPSTTAPWWMQVTSWPFACVCSAVVSSPQADTCGSNRPLCSISVSLSIHDVSPSYPPPSHQPCRRLHSFSCFHCCLFYSVFFFLMRLIPCSRFPISLAANFFGWFHCFFPTI